MQSNKDAEETVCLDHPRKLLQLNVFISVCVIVRKRLQNLRLVHTIVCCGQPTNNGRFDCVSAAVMMTDRLLTHGVARGVAD